MNADSTRQSILAILAHPDDETFLIGGALALYARRGHDVRVLYGPFGTDAAGRPPPQRAAELSDAARALGLTDWSFLSPIGDDGPALTQGIFAELRWLRPRVVLTFDATGATGNPDHIAVGRAARDAVDALNTATAPEPPVRLYAIVFGRRQMSIALRLAALTRRAGGAALRDALRVAQTTQRPTTRIDVRGVLAQRREAARCYTTALAEGAWWMRRWELLSPRLRGLIAPREVYARLIPPFPPGAPPEADFFEGTQ